MKKGILLILLIVLSIGRLIASDYYVGYCNGKLAESAQIYFSGEKEVKVAVELDTQRWGKLSGCDINAINVGLLSKLKLQSVDVWISTSLDSEPVVLKNVPKADLMTGWNNILLDNPYKLDGNTIFIGYTLHQSGQCMAISTYEGLPTESLHVKDGDSEWVDYSSQECGALGIEAIVVGDNIPQYDFRVSNLEFASDDVKKGAPAYLKFNLENCGVQTVKDIEVKCEIEGIDSFNVSLGETIEYRATKDVSFKVHIPKEVENCMSNVRIAIENLDGHADETPEDSCVESTISIYDEKYLRKSLVEEFSTETCGNCPRVAGYLQESLQSYGESERIIPVVHHSGFVYDRFTIDASKEYEKFYQSGIYAPMVMFDRYEIDGSVETIPSSANDITRWFDLVLERETNIDINLDMSVEDNILKVRAFGQKRDGFDLVEPRLTVFVVEDNVPADNQAGETGIIKGYIHRHVIRAVNETWGTPLVWSGDNYQVETEVELNTEEWDMNQVEVIAFISDYVENDYRNRAVANVENMPYLYAKSIEINETGIESIETNADQRVKICIVDRKVEAIGEYKNMSIYTMSGNKVSTHNLSSGIYVVMIELSNGRQQTEKIIIK